MNKSQPDEWKAVSDGLPTEDGVYIVTCLWGDGTIETTFFDFTVEHEWGIWKNNDHPVIAYMPLPAPFVPADTEPGGEGPTCKRCTVCEGQTHHWREGFKGEDPIWECAHCPRVLPYGDCTTHPGGCDCPDCQEPF